MQQNHIIQKISQFPSIYFDLADTRINTSEEKKLSTIAIILEKYFGKSCPDMIGSVSAIDKCSRKHGTRFNNRYAKFEIAFSTMAGTMVELGYNNIYTYMQKKMISK